MSGTVSKITCIAYAVAVFGCLLLLPFCEGLTWRMYSNLPGMMVLGLAVIGALLARYVVFGKEDLSWWMTLWIFVGLAIILSLLFLIELSVMRHSIVT